MKRLIQGVLLLGAMLLRLEASSYEEALLEARKESKSLLLVVCPKETMRCRQSEREILPHPALQAALRSYHLLRLEPKEAPSGLKTPIFPSYYIVDSLKGEVIRELRGHQSVIRLKLFLEGKVVPTTP